jgi:hypothetical protein
MLRCLAISLVLSFSAFAQYAYVQPAERRVLPKVIDGNTAATWLDGQLYIFHSTGVPTRSHGPDQFSLANTVNVDFDSEDHKPVWFEAVYRDPDGTLFLWYHNEPGGVCESNKLTRPRIGAAISYDNGKTVRDLGIVLDSGDPVDCNAKNGFFAGGHGDFSVILDRQRRFFYFFFTNYAGALEEQGVAVARMPYDARRDPAGAVTKYYRGRWSEPGIGGHISPVFPASVSWQAANTDSHWGPSIHWNTYLRRFVILMNHACCTPGWPQVGVYASFSANLANPASWSHPIRLLEAKQLHHHPGYYPQVLGLERNGTDREAGQVARLYVHGESDYEIVFRRIAPTFTPLDPCQGAATCPDSPEPDDDPNLP